MHDDSIDQPVLYKADNPLFYPEIQGFRPLVKVVQTELFLIWDPTSSRVIVGGLWEVRLMIGGRDQDRNTVLLLPIGNCVLGRSEKSRTRGAFVGIRGRHPYSNGRAKIQSLDGFVEMVRDGLRILDPCTN